MEIVTFFSGYFSKIIESRALNRRSASARPTCSAGHEVGPAFCSEQGPPTPRVRLQWMQYLYVATADTGSSDVRVCFSARLMESTSWWFVQVNAFGGNADAHGMPFCRRSYRSFSDNLTYT